ncbi:MULTISPECIES: hypothetical protein [unclassified Pseudodesulfovibrio]|uniref:hypothetical protein n=1 Tax=unclassified Pseudodesulfovibrio TaxID=2661612 RepID=UPI000FEB8979|nr:MULTISPECIES: hypothetical protein [unclassified Pseudodesulfovibrio]MCJ2164692.1 hypothetical protein [Pseudodesulfovibrio sp. S3-i]RWU04116.1 hypothetical protein DWB63_08910 [Pseudodesulfovibrio sp. S3]
MKMTKAAIEELVKGKKSQTLSVKQLYLDIDMIKKRSPRHLDALAADSLDLLLRIASMTKSKNKRKSLLEGIKAVTTALDN